MTPSTTPRQPGDDGNTNHYMLILQMGKLRHNEIKNVLKDIQLLSLAFLIYKFRNVWNFPFFIFSPPSMFLAPSSGSPFLSPSPFFSFSFLFFFSVFCFFETGSPYKAQAVLELTYSVGKTGLELAEIHLPVPFQY